ncbi:MAG: CRISPR-associated helicase Cas3' [Acidobacteria bacterium]|nr:CRISPR-associated helicase Cas3' [Acidobacteriota bacterium]
MTEPLLAKSYCRRKHPNKPPDYALLVQHSRDVAAACNTLADIVGRVALQNAALSGELFDLYKLAQRANGWGQDLGKASSHFQKMVSRPNESHPQLLRHETISGLLLYWEGSPLARWFAELSLPRSLWLAALWGAMGHHRKFDKDTVPGQCEKLTVEITNPDFRIILKEMAASLGLDMPEIKRDLVFVRTRDEISDPSIEFGAFESVRQLQGEFKKICKSEQSEFTDENARRVLALIKGFGIAADVAASAVAKREYEKRGQSRAEFVADFVKTKLETGLTANDLTGLVKQKVARSLEIQRDAGEDGETTPFRFRRFQKKVARAADRDAYLTLARAGCGSGKSLAAYLWARRWCKRFKREGRTNFRLFFCLPTTGTTTEHYKDYALESGIKDARLIHSRAEIDLEEITRTAPQETDPREEQDRIESLELWDTPLVVCTTDTVLGLMANARRAVYSLPALMCGAVVFDEVHAFDEQLFGHLLVFLKNFPRLPVLLMTASLPDERLRAIKKVRPDFIEDRDSIRGPVEFEELPRYLIREAQSEQEVREEVEKCVRAGGKVLWVCNRVERANKKYAEWREYCQEQGINAEVNVYHARFRYENRSRRHSRVIKSFKKEDNAAILVATQVAEMSLDLSADLLVTDIAPITALIQRMGRLNRRALPTDPKEKRPPKLALVCPLPADEEAKPLPYEEEELKAARLWLQKFAGMTEGVSQRHLSEQFAKLSRPESVDLELLIEDAEKNACFFSGLWETRPGQTRGDGYTVSVILKQDLEKCNDRNRNGEPTRKWIRAHEVAIPFRPEVLKWERVGGVRCAPHEAVMYDYDEKTEEGTGAEWR